MKVKEVFIKYSKIVPFPWTERKIKKAGHNPQIFLIQLGQELERCEDIDTPTAKDLLRSLKELSILS